MKKRSTLFWIVTSIAMLIFVIFIFSSFAIWWNMERKVSKDESLRCASMSPDDMKKDILESIKHKKLNNFYTTHDLDNYEVVNLSNKKEPSLPRVNWTFDLKSKGSSYYLHGMIDCSTWRTEYSVIK